MKEGFITDFLRKYFDRGNAKRRCMTCKYWYPVEEDKGDCIKNRDPIRRYPNYCCDSWTYWKG